MRRSCDTPYDETIRFQFPKTAAIEEPKEKDSLPVGDHLNSGSQVERFVRSDDWDDKTNSGYFCSVIENMFQRQFPSKIKSELLPTAMDLDATIQNLQTKQNVTAILEAEEIVVKAEEDKAKSQLDSVHESVRQTINSVHYSIPSQDSDS